MIFKRVDTKCNNSIQFIYYTLCHICTMLHLHFQVTVHCYGSVLGPHKHFTFFNLHTFFCKIYTFFCKIYTFFCKFYTFFCKFYTFFCKIYTFFCKIYTFFCKFYTFLNDYYFRGLLLSCQHKIIYLCVTQNIYIIMQTWKNRTT